MKSATPNEDTLLKDHCFHEQEFDGFTTQSLELLQEQKQGEKFFHWTANSFSCVGDIHIATGERKTCHHYKKLPRWLMEGYGT